jgi:polyketide synthase PksJ
MAHSKIDKGKVEDILPLTAMQEGMLFHYLSNPRSKQYFEQFRFRLEGDLDVRLFKAAWQAVAHHNEMLRAVVRWEKLDEPVQVVLKAKEIPIEIKDLPVEDGEGQSRRLAGIVEEDWQRGIDLGEEPLRITLCRLDSETAEMLVTFHHILYDGWSSGILLSEFLEAYHRLTKGERPETVHKTRYGQFLHWYRSQDREKQGLFWKHYLEGFDTHSQLPYDHGKRQEISRVATHGIEISPQLKRRLDACLRAHRLTLSNLIYTAWGLVLQKYNCSDDVLFGTTVAGRTPEVKGIERMVGLFINTLPLRFKARGDEPVLKVLDAVGRHLEERAVHEHSALTDIHKSAGIGRRGSLFDSIVVVDNYPLADVIDRQHTPLTISGYQLFEMTSFDMTLQAMLFETRPLRLDFHYNADLFEAGTIRRLANHYVNILGGLADHPQQPVSTLVMLSEEENRQILDVFNRPRIAYRLARTIHREIEAKLEQWPMKTALRFEDRWLVSGELNARANRLARGLKRLGIGRGSRVAMLLPRSPEMIVSLLAILKSGAAAIPLDVSYPPERNRFIIRDSDARLVLSAVAPGVEGEGTGGIDQLVVDPHEFTTLSGKNPAVPVEPEDPAYIIYTSGSTGKPKGALLHHSGIVNHTHTKIEVLGIGPQDTVANNFSINVIASVWQILSPLFVGGRLVVYTEELEWDPYRQFERVAIDGVSVIEVIPPVLKAFLFLLDEGKEKIDFFSLRKIALTSEETKPFVVNRFYERYKAVDLVDCYGQTECCDDVLHYTIPVNTDTRKVPIGTPSLNTRVVVLNHHDQLQPVGVAGEICVSGAGVGYGYWNRPDLTAEKFVPDPLQPGVRMYRTGDLGRWLPDGKVEFLGRLDHQVKIRGNRVELREIENHILRYPSLKETAVVARQDRQGDQNLYAFFVSPREVTASDMRGFLLNTLPDYMVPAHFIRLDELPLTPNGKIDRKALLKMKVDSGIASGADYIPPRSDFEKAIRTIWGQLLETAEAKIGINDNFFDLGGHSLLLIKLKSKLEKRFPLEQEIGIIELFNYPTIGHQARYIEAHMKDKAGAGTKEEIPVPAVRGSVPSDSDLAVIGMALRVPGARNIGEFWHNLANGIESISFFSEDELEGAAVEDFVAGNSAVVAAGGVLTDIDLFDADFFGFNPREAEIIEPQQRLFLEYAWSALEDAGYVGDTYDGLIGVYAGVGLNTYLLNNVMAHREVVAALGEFQTMIGSDKDFLATRVAYKLNLKGPAITVQSACSTSLAAVHLARQGLLAFDCDMALVGGVAVHVPEKTGYFYNEGGYLSPDGHCRAFDARANGTVFGNGIGVVVLKRLADALCQRDFIYAKVKGSAINNDGSLKVGYTSPSEIGQAAVISRALARAGVEPHTIGYIEAHGTGTVLGDPVEMAALKRAFHQAGGDGKRQYCAVGSLKSSTGHLDIAAGVVGLIKGVLCLRHRQIPPSINIEEPNPMIDFDNTPFYVNCTLSPWPGSGTPRRAGVSSFGIGGTNAHVVLEEYNPGEADSPRPDGHQLILLSARSERALEKLTANLLAYLQQETDAPLQDVAYTLKLGRQAFAHRLAVVCRDREDAVEALESFDPKRILKHVCLTGDKTVVWMFSGVGEHYVNMGRELYAREPLFRQQVDGCCDILKPLLDRDLRQVLFDEKRAAAANKSPEGAIDFRRLAGRTVDNPGAPEESIDQTLYCQTAVFVVEYALAQLLLSWGIKPHAMIGYSIGEYVAACLAGVFSLADALQLVAERARLIHQLERGAMTAVSLSEEELRPLLGEGVSLVAVNTPELCVVSGQVAGIEALEGRLQAKNAVFRRLKTFQAFHSPMMRAVRKELTGVLQTIHLHPPRIPYISNVTGTWIEADEVVKPGYWLRHTENPLRFSDGIGELLKTSCHFLVEVGPGNSLCGFVAQQAKASKQAPPPERFVLASMPKESERVSGDAFLLRTLGRLWVGGLDIDWSSYYRHRPCRRLPLPTYPFEGRRYWLEPASLPTGERKAPPPANCRPVRIEKEENIADWFYLPGWRQSVPPLGSHNGDSAPQGDWLFFLDEDPTSPGPGLIDRLKQAAPPPDITIVRPGREFVGSRENGLETFVIDPARCEHYLELLKELRRRDKKFVRIVHLWQWSGAADFLERGVYSLLYLVKAMGALSLFDPLELWMVSRGLHRLESSDTGSPEKAAILGPCKVIGQEYPNIVCRSLDFQEGSGTNGDEDEREVVENLLAELLASPAEPVIAYRGFSRWIQSYQPLKLSAGPEVPALLRPKGVYLITGGLGKIGLTIARCLARSVQARLVLTSRSGLPSDEKDNLKMEAIRQLKELGAEVLVLAADVADREQMKAVVRRAETGFGVLHGAIHAAGVMDESAFKLIADLDRQGCELHFKTKIYGLRVLAEVLRGRELDFCLLTSSLSPILGGLSLFAYSAANSFMDGFAQRQTLVKGERWLSINWADWQQEPASESCANLVLGSTVFQLNITPQEGEETFKRVLHLSANGRKVPEVVISSGNLSARLAQWVRGAEDVDPGDINAPATQPVHKRPQLQSIYEAPQNEAETIVAEIWQELLGIELVGVYDNFFELGGHSLIATRLISRLREIFRIDIPLPTLFDRPTVREVVDSIVQTWGDGETVEEIARTYREVFS